jgi:hypothetical protein
VRRETAVDEYGMRRSKHVPGRGCPWSGLLLQLRAIVGTRQQQRGAIDGWTDAVCSLRTRGEGEEAPREPLQRRCKT